MKTVLKAKRVPALNKLHVEVSCGRIYIYINDGILSFCILFGLMKRIEGKVSPIWRLNVLCKFPYIVSGKCSRNHYIIIMALVVLILCVTDTLGYLIADHTTNKRKIKPC